MSITLGDIAAALQQVVRNLGGLDVYDTPVLTPNLPVAMVIPPAIDYVEAMRSGTRTIVTLPFEIYLFDGTSAGSEQQAGLWPYLDWVGSRSIAAAVFADRTIGLVGANGGGVDAHVASTRPLGMEEMPEYAAIGHVLSVPVVVTNRE